MLQGVNLEFYCRPSATVPGRGDHRERGRVHYEDLEELRRSGLRSAIVGKAIYEGRVKLEDLFR